MHNYVNPLFPPLTCLSERHQHWGRLYGSSVGLVLSQAAQSVPLVVITPDPLSAQHLIDDIQFYAGEGLSSLSFPDWETLPYDVFSPHQDIISERLTTLYQLPNLKRGVLVLPVTTIMHRLPPANYVQAYSLLIIQGQHLNAKKLREQLELSGYRCVSQVIEHGEFAVRGSLLDLFPMGSNVPYRIDLFDEEVESIRSFDPDTQRSQETVHEIRFLPAREFPLTKESIALFRSQWRIEFGRDPTRCPVYQEVSTGWAPAGVEYYLPLFFEQTHSLFNYLPPQSILVTLPGVVQAAEQFWKEVSERYELLRHDIERPLLPPVKLFLQVNQVFAEFHHYPHILLHEEETVHPEAINFSTCPPPSLPVEARATHPLGTFQKFMDEFKGRFLIAAETLGRREILLELFKKYDFHPIVVENWQTFLHHEASLCLTVAPLEQGLILEGEHPVAVISETQFFGERVVQRRLRKKIAQRDTEAIVRDLTELTIGLPVVHLDHGVGRYQGLVKMDMGGIAAEFLQLEYAQRDKLYVPVTSLHLISRFTGVDPEHAPLHRLGSGQWEKAKRKATQKAYDVAVELLDIYARRTARQGHLFKKDDEAYRAFVEGFPFEETPDQEDAIEAVLHDMYSAQPMDRLICGDVGFGKTEVAMRATFIAVLDSQQVAVLVPTTLLTQQHYQNFLDRFADWPIRIEQLSRFSSAKQQKETLKAIEEGKVDIIIGTHKLLQENVKFKKLGLVIIDEEHRFGVKQKERFKALRAEVDVLTLTATPIPRSLNMALSNLRDLSVIATPPAGRLAVKTFVKEWHVPTIVEAITRELKRGGQVYFLHNDIDSIERMAQEVQKFVPDARVHIAHGKMRERELERVMQDFYHRRFNVLVCTTIIETGIDVPSANTIIINRADKLGLAQLYQLRGRVGRSHHRAYAYLIVPPRSEMTKDAIKRLDAISAIEELGMGFTLATHDLEIRGAGELLGDEQSGHMQEIGFTLYTELLERAVEAIKSGRQPELERPIPHGTEINLYTPVLLPNTYLPDVHTRLIMYKRIAHAPHMEALSDIQIEMIDRFGLLPEPTKALIKIAELRLRATPLGIRKIEFSAEGGYLLFDETTSVSPECIIRLIQAHPQQYKLEKQKFRLLFQLPEFSDRCQVLESIFNSLSH